MRHAILVILATGVLAVAGCGEDDEAESAAGDRETSRAAPSEREAERPEVRPARTDADCVRLWNSTLRPGTAGQKAPEDFLIEIASKRPTRVLVRYFERECLVVVPFGPKSRAGYAFVAIGGRAPYNHPGRIPIEPGAHAHLNAEASEDGRLRLR